MAAMLGGGGDGALPLETWFYEMPICTRTWTTATVVTSVLVQCHIITPFQLFYSFRAVFVKSQVRFRSFDKMFTESDLLRRNSTGVSCPPLSISARCP
jgi:hypothetical protein